MYLMFGIWLRYQDYIILLLKYFTILQSFYIDYMIT